MVTFAVNNRLFVNLLGVFVVVAGLISLMTMNREVFPNVSLDIVRIDTQYPGNPNEIERLITNPIEEQLKSVADLKRVESISGEGFSNIYITIEDSAADKEKVISDISQALGQVKDLPSDLQDPPVATEIKTQDTPVIEIVISGNQSRDLIQGWIETIKSQVEEISSVSRLVKKGWRDPEVWVEIDGTALAKRQLSLIEVNDALRRSLIKTPLGSFNREGQESLVRLSRDTEDPKAMANWPIRGNFSGSDVPLSSVASVRMAYEDNKQIFRLNGMPAVGLVVLKKESGDTITLVEQIQQIVDDARPKIEQAGLQVSLVNDLSFYVKRRLDILMNNSWIGLVLVVLSLFFFLSRTIAIWTAVGLPVAICFALWLMGIFGITINLISMFGLIIILGMLVDDSIVVAESIYRNMEEGFSAREAAIKGTYQVFKPVLMTILTTIVFFLPLIFMSGIFGKFVRQIPIIVIITLIASLLECFFILPSHLADFGKLNQTQKNREGGAYFKLLNGYERFLRWALSHAKKLTVLSLVMLISGIWIGFQYIPINLFPSKDIEIFFVRFEAASGSRETETLALIEPFEKMVAEIPATDLKDFVTNVGVIQQDPNDPATLLGSQYAQIAIFLHPRRERQYSTPQLIANVRAKIDQMKAPKLKIWIDQVNPGPPQGKPVDIKVSGPRFEPAKKIVAEIREFLSDTPGVRDIRDDFDSGKSEFVLRPNMEAFTRTQTSQLAFGQVMRTAFFGEKVGTLLIDEEERDVMVKMAPSAQSFEKTFAQLWIPNNQLRYIPAKRLSEVSFQETTSYVRHKNFKRVVNLSANIDEAKTSSWEVNAKLKTAFGNVAQAYPGFGIEYGGQEKDTEESLDSLLRASVMALLMAFLILATTFNSLTQPLLILLAVPYGVCAALAALWLHGEPLSFLALLGLVGLSGVTVNDSVIMIDRINSAIRESKIKNVREAIVKASRERLRPVILTSITTIMGLGPIAYGIGGSDPFLEPMAITIAWGLAFATILTLFLIPCAYLTMHALLNFRSIEK